MTASICRFIIVALLAVSGATHAEQPLRIFAAASLTNALNDIAVQWQQAGHPKPSLAFSSSATLARQIEADAPADVFASADIAWMDYLAKRGAIAPDTRVDLLGNELVLIVPKGRKFPLRLAADFDIAAAFDGKLCTGDPDVVPVGIYAKQSLQSLRWWPALASRIVGADDARSALAFVERGECALGIVYATDAKISGQVDVIGRFPADSHAPIVYPFAATKHARPAARAFLHFLRSSPAAAAVFQHYGFIRRKN
jgi:molybdate transport system substrate-binding protein